MKVSFWRIAPLIIAWLFSSCVPIAIPATPAITDTQLPYPTPALPTFTPIPYNTTTATMTPLFKPTSSLTQNATELPVSSLEPKKANEKIKTMMREHLDCSNPCFWGIVPEQTTLGEAKNILTNLGLEIRGTSNNHFRYGTSFELDNGMSVLITFTGTDDFVESLRVFISPEKQKAGVSREWLAYSPEMMIRRYGQPSRVDLFLGRAASHTQFSMVVYFDVVDTIIDYYWFDIGSDTRICPLSDQIDDIRLWMGNNPVDPPLSGQSLEKTTGLTMEAFSKLMIGDPDQACIDLVVEMFP